MELRLERILGKWHPHLAKISSLLETTFPECERESIPEFLADLEAGRGHQLWCLCGPEGEFLGFARGMVFPKVRRGWIVHIALAPEERGAGLGAKLFELVWGAMAVQVDGFEGIYLEVERIEDAADDEERVARQKRLGFFDRLGARLVSTEYIQPPSQPGQPPVPLNLLFWGESADSEGKMLSDFYEAAFGRE